jgi:hypothetical protein
VTITSSSQRIVVTSHKALGSSAVGGAENLYLYIGYRAGTAGAVDVVGGGAIGNRVSQNTRITMGLSAMITGLPPGTYEVGLAGRSTTPANWNYNDWGYTTAVVH